MAYQGFGGYAGYSAAQMSGMQMQMGQAMSGAVQGVPHGTYAGYPYSAGDPMWSYFTAVAGQQAQKPPYNQMFQLKRDVKPQWQHGHPLKFQSSDPLGYAHSNVEDGEVDAEELQRCLTQSGLHGTYTPFSLETCRIMIAMLDRDHTGKMGFNEFKELWAALNAWKQNFTMFDQDRSGTVEPHELGQAIAAMGYRLSHPTLNAIVKRYSKNGRIYFDDYVACCVKLRALTDVLRRRDNMQQGFVNFAYDDFLQCTMAI
ncbi:grancalcin isoform X1 [Ambystoma mexicanum]|uniref:grancalcin isoform X1 n=1 Tax=Ambystoma mexicanum TaxID=8296 RepID=UPI0037E7DE70